MTRGLAVGGFTLIELLVVITIIAILMGLLIPVVGMVKEQSRKATANAMIRQIHMCLNLYRDEDQGGRRYPPVAADGFIRYDTHADTGTELVNLLMRFGALKEGIQKLAEDPASGQLRVLVDPWDRPYRYAIDDNMDGITDRPAPKLDWNARNVEPFAYVWSLGTPNLGTMRQRAGDPDANPANSKNWIYQKNTAKAP